MYRENNISHDYEKTPLEYIPVSDAFILFFHYNHYLIWFLWNAPGTPKNEKIIIETTETPKKRSPSILPLKSFPCKKRVIGGERIRQTITDADKPARNS
jgi:hypothetical protein